ncbi:MAG: 30S ribosomal protein S9 [Bdellovibrio sp. CG10_big_fil_rev_8_21_14_0_10_47_8]|nr:MAG: 30S ribosomal protein S9 [Bdellovibrio sp. CG10_big_fil_rev_8_21_14_0_10_47_8]
MAAAEKVYYATGRRKTSAARVFLMPGKGKIEINGVEADKYLKRMQSKMVIQQPFDVVDQHGKFDVVITVCGGGENGQTGAIRLGIARALTAFNADFRPPLKKAGYLTRDPRMVERKKYGLRGARRRGQYSKR